MHIIKAVFFWRKYKHSPLSKSMAWKPLQWLHAKLAVKEAWINLVILTDVASGCYHHYSELNFVYPVLCWDCNNIHTRLFVIILMKSNTVVLEIFVVFIAEDNIFWIAIIDFIIIKYCYFIHLFYNIINSETAAYG